MAARCTVGHLPEFLESFLQAAAEPAARLGANGKHVLVKDVLLAFRWAPGRMLQTSKPESG